MLLGFVIALELFFVLVFIDRIATLLEKICIVLGG